MRALLVPVRHPLWGALECRHRHDQALQVKRSAFLSPLYHAHSVRVCARRLLVDQASEHGCEADMDFLAYSICDLCGLDCSEVLRRARSRLAYPSIRHQAEFQHQANNRLIAGQRGPRTPLRANFRVADHLFVSDSVNSQNEQSSKEHPSSQVTAASSSDSIARVCYRAICDRDDLKTIHEH